MDLPAHHRVLKFQISIIIKRVPPYSSEGRSIAVAGILPSVAGWG